MKQILLFLFSPLFMFIEASEYSIVFVHIGKTLPSYLDTAVEQAYLFNKTENIYLVANQSVLDQYENEHVTCVSCESLEKTSHHKFFEENTVMDKEWREGFWKAVVERFFYLDELIAKYDLKNTVHLEYDNMLYVDIRELLPIFEKHYSGIAAVFANPTRVIPGFIYLKNKFAAHELATFLANTSKLKLNDMHAIALYYLNSSSKEIDYLPTVCEEYASDFTLITNAETLAPKELILATKELSDDKSHYYNHIDEFNSIFDGAAIGQYLGGQHPLNPGNSMPGQINRHSNYDPSKLDYEWILDEEGRSVPYIVYKNKKYRINNIHVHSKNLKPFSSLVQKPGKVNVSLAPEKDRYIPYTNKIASYERIRTCLHSNSKKYPVKGH